MYVVLNTNIGIYAIHEGSDLEAAKQAAVRSGFESSVYKDGKLFATWSPIGGWRNQIY